MLRPPERLLASLNYLRLFIKTKVYQLTKPPPPPDPPAIIFNLAIVNRIQQHHFIHNKFAFNQQARLLKVIQERFPIVNVLASPVLRPIPAFQPAAFLSRGFQLRTITSNPSAATTFPRTAFIGYGSPGFARNFSSVKAATFFNANTGVGTAAADGPANFLAQYSTRTFAVAPKANIVNQPTGSHNQSTSLKVGRIDEDEVKQETKREQQCHGAYNVAKPGYKLFTADSKGIFEVVLCAEKNDIRARKPRLVRRVTAIRRAAAEKMMWHETVDPVEPVAQLQSTDPLAADLGDAMRDIISDPLATDLGDAMRDVISDPRVVVAEPPDRALRSNTKRKKPHAGTMYISIPLDVATLVDVDALVPSRKVRPTFRPGSPSPAQHLDTSLIRGVEDVAEMYQAHFRAVAHVLRTLKQYGEFEVTIIGCEMRVLFPPQCVVVGEGPKKWDREGIEQWLRSIGIDPESPHFTVETVVETAADEESSNHEEEMQDENLISLQQVLAVTVPDCDATLFDASEDSDDDLVVVPSLDASIVSVSALYSQTLSTQLGPEYFRRVQEFLDVVDDLIETSPAFVRARAVDEEEFVRV